MRIPDSIIKIIQKTCDLDFNGYLDRVNANKENEVSIFNAARKTYDANAGTYKVKGTTYFVPDAEAVDLRSPEYTEEDTHSKPSVEETTSEEASLIISPTNYAEQAAELALQNSTVKKNLMELLDYFAEVASENGISASLLTAICLDKSFMLKPISKDGEANEDSISLEEMKNNILKEAKQFKKALDESDGDMKKALNKYYINDVSINEFMAKKINSSHTKAQQIIELSQSCEETIIPKIKQEKLELARKEELITKMYEKWSKRFPNSPGREFYEKLYDVIDLLEIDIPDEQFLSDIYRTKKDQAMDEILAIFAQESGLNPRARNKYGYTGLFQLGKAPLKTVKEWANKHPDFPGMENIDQRMTLSKYRELSGEEQLDYFIAYICSVKDRNPEAFEGSISPSRARTMVLNPKKAETEKRDTKDDVSKDIQYQFGKFYRGIEYDKYPEDVAQNL